MSVEASPETERPERAAARQTRTLLIVAVALLLLKLLWVSQREMVPEQHDAEAYASASMQDLGALFTVAAGHPPGASLVMALARLFGIPYRIFIELFLALATFLFLRPLFVFARIGIVATTLIYFVLICHPALLLEMDRPMSDSVSFICWLIGVGGIAGFVASPREKFPYWSLGIAIVGFAFVGITRTGEGLIVLVEMAAIALLSSFLFRGADDWRRRRTIVVCLVAIVANFAATQALSAAHYRKNGYWGPTAVESKEWWRLYSTLLSLPVQRTDRTLLVNKATMEMAESFSEDLRNMDACIWGREGTQPEGLGMYSVQWIIIDCLPGDNSSKHYERMRAISTDIANNARDHHVDLLPPVLGIIPQPATQWLPDLPGSFEEVATQVVETPRTTRVAQNSWQEALFDRALLRRTALVATGENPEVFGYLSFVRGLYTGLAMLFWPSVPIAFLVVAATAIRPATSLATTGLIAFAISIMVIDVICRISFYSIVDWILWGIIFRYILGASVISVVIVTTLLCAWLGPAVGAALRPTIAGLPGLRSLVDIREHSNRRA